MYNRKGELLGAIGVSGDTSCADHNIAWRARKNLALDMVPGGVSPVGDDNIIYYSAREGANGFKHPECGNKEAEIELPAVAKKLEPIASGAGKGVESAAKTGENAPVKQ